LEHMYTTMSCSRNSKMHLNQGWLNQPITNLLGWPLLQFSNETSRSARVPHHRPLFRCPPTLIPHGLTRRVPSAMLSQPVHRRPVRSGPTVDTDLCRHGAMSITTVWAPAYVVYLPASTCLEIVDPGIESYFNNFGF
jgi:hypothetical protein